MPQTFPNFSTSLIDRIIKGRCADLADLLGLQRAADGGCQLAAFLPGATRVIAVSPNGKRHLGELGCLHAEGLFAGRLSAQRKPDYRLLVETLDGWRLQDDPYRLPALDVAELELLHSGRHEQGWRLLGAWPTQRGTTAGVQFVVWAPGAHRVSVLLDSNGWDGRVTVLRPHQPSGLWELFVPALSVGSRYRFEALSPEQSVVQWLDPFARALSPAEDAALVAAAPSHSWHDAQWLERQRDQAGQAAPLLLHDVYVGAGALWVKSGWSELAQDLGQLARRRGFTHVCVHSLLTWRGRRAEPTVQWLADFLPPQDAALPPSGVLPMVVDTVHGQEVGLVLDLPLPSLLWNPLAAAHARGSVVWEAGSPLLRSLLVGIVDYWVKKWHIDGVKLSGLDAWIAETRQRGTPAAHALREWLRDCLQRLRDRHPSLLLLVETQETWPELTLACDRGGMGADHRLSPPSPSVQAKPPQNLDANPLRKIRQLMLAEDVSLVDAQLQALLQWTLPGAKQLCRCSILPSVQHEDHSDLFPPAEFADAWWTWLAALNRLYLEQPPLHELDGNPEGIALLLDHEGVVVVERRPRHPRQCALLLLNFGQQPRSIVLPGLRVAALLQRAATDAAELPPRLDLADLLGDRPVLVPPRCGALYCTD
jgi:hypothetical protein